MASAASRFRHEAIGLRWSFGEDEVSHAAGEEHVRGLRSAAGGAPSLNEDFGNLFVAGGLQSVLVIPVVRFAAPTGFRDVRAGVGVKRRVGRLVVPDSPEAGWGTAG